MIAVILAGALVVLTLYKNSRPDQSVQSLVDYKTYQNSQYGFTIQYPQDWRINEETQVFENGDAVSFRKDDPKQKDQTELTDGAMLAVAVPFGIKEDLKSWVKSYFSNPNDKIEFSTRNIRSMKFEKVYECSRVGCMTYYFTFQNDQVFGIAAFAEGANKAAYENTLASLLSTFELKDKVGGGLSSVEAIKKVKSLPEVVDYLKRVPSAKVEVNEAEGDAYLIQVFEVINGHTATFNWYTVSKVSGEASKSFKN